MVFVLRRMNDPNGQYGIEYTACQLVALQDIKKELNEEVSNDRLNQKVAAASLLFIKHCSFIKQQSALLYFAGVIGYHLGWKRWKGPDTYTLILAGIQWVMRVVILESAIPKDQCDNWLELHKDDPLQCFNSDHHKYLVEGEAYPYDQIHTLLNYRLKASINVTSRSQIDWSPDRKILYLDGKPLKMKAWKRLDPVFKR